MIKSKDRKVNKKKVFLYADSILNAAMYGGGLEEALRVRSDFASIDKAMLVNDNVLTRFDINDIKGSTEEAEEKIEQAVRVICEGASEALIEVIVVMCINHDLSLILAVASNYEWLLTHWLGKTVVDVTTVVPLDDHLRDVITKKATNDLDCEVVLHEHIDKRILGGVILNANGKVLDSSINTHLLQMRQSLLSYHTEVN